MATYLIGDVHGMFDSLMALVEQCGFYPANDRLWFVGDLVNRGPHSLETLRYIKNLGNAAVSVLGNHDLHLLALAAGVGDKEKNRNLLPLLIAPDRDELLQWLRHRPLIYREEEWLLVHAGIWPEWSIDEALRLAGEVESRLRSDTYHSFLSHMYGDEPSRWDDSLRGMARLRFIINALTRMRTLDAEGKIDLRFTGPPADMPQGHHHWFDEKRWFSTTILSGHWAAQGICRTTGMVALDSGAVWGGPLTAFRLDDGALFQTPPRIGESP